MCTHPIVFRYRGPSVIMPIICPINGTLGWTTGGSLGSTLMRRRLERKTPTAIMSPATPIIADDKTMMAAQIASRASVMSEKVAGIS
jgi:hypothetical protein